MAVVARLLPVLIVVVVCYLFYEGWRATTGKGTRIKMDRTRVLFITVIGIAVAAMLLLLMIGETMH